MLAEEKQPEHREKADPRDGVLNAQGCEGQGDEREQAAECEHVVAATDVQYLFVAALHGEQVARQQDGSHKHLCLPQRLQSYTGHCHHDRGVGRRGQAVVPPLPQAQSRPDDDAHHHRPAGAAEEAVVPLQGQPHESAAQGDGDAVMGVAAEDAHEEHEQIPPSEVFLADSGVLSYEEGDDALGR